MDGAGVEGEERGCGARQAEPDHAADAAEQRHVARLCAIDQRAERADACESAASDSSRARSVKVWNSSRSAVSDANFSRFSASALLFLENNIGHISAIYLFILVLMMFRCDFGAA